MIRERGSNGGEINLPTPDYPFFFLQDPKKKGRKKKNKGRRAPRERLISTLRLLPRCCGPVCLLSKTAFSPFIKETSHDFRVEDSLKSRICFG